MRARPIEPWPVCAWPLPAPTGAPCVVVALALPHDLPRAQARLRVREVAQALIAQRLGCQPADVTLQALPGQAPRVAGSAMGISFAHEPGCSLVAIHDDGAVGVDVVRCTLPPDWEPVARDYLDPATLAQLVRLDDSHRVAAFARAWSTREATLKLHDQPLREWCDADTHLRADCHPLALPPGWAGTLALPTPALA
ncbi:MAG: 4'-phosphopantetheinyl transferase superfamily protein [Rhodoferax sp.]